MRFHFSEKTEAEREHGIRQLAAYIIKKSTINNNPNIDLNRDLPDQYFNKNNLF